MNSKQMTADEILTLLENGNVSDVEMDDDGDEEYFTENQHPEAIIIEPEDSEYLQESQIRESNIDLDQQTEAKKKWENNMRWGKRVFKSKSKLVRPNAERGSNYYQEETRRTWEEQDYFSQYFSSDLYKSLALYTNMRSVYETGTSIDVTDIEIKKFIGINIYMSSLGYPSMRMCWAKDTRVPLIANNMSRDRFLKIRNSLKVLDDASVTEEAKRKDVLWKVRPFLEQIRNGCMKQIRTNHLSIDEQVIPFQGSLRIKQYIKGKPNPVGLKNFVLADESGLVLDFCIYQGKGTFPENDCLFKLSLGESAVWKLSESVPPKSCLYFDRFFTTEKLVDLLLSQKKIMSTGTLMKNQIPKQVRSKLTDFKKTTRGNVEQVTREDKNLVCVQWKDNKPITLISSESGKFPLEKATRWSKKDLRRIELPLPSCIAKYNKYMGGVDLADRMISLYRIKSRTKKWTLRVFLHFVDLAASNSWILYKKDHFNYGTPRKNVSQFLKFRFDLANQLIHSFNDEEAEANDSDSDYDLIEAIENNNLIVNTNQPVPSKAFRTKGAEHLPRSLDMPFAQRCRNISCKGRSRVICTRCKVVLCSTKEKACFIEFHTK